MQTIVAPQCPVVRRRSPTTCLRQGYLGAHAAAKQLVKLCAPQLDPTLAAKAGLVEAAVSNVLRHSAQLAIGHPTLRTLKDAFEATEAVLRFTAQAGRRAGRLVDVGLQIRVQLLLIGVRAGLTEMEQGLEAIPLLPTNAPDYPEVE